MNLDHQQKKSLVAWCLKEGYALEYGKLSLCDLRNYRHSQIYQDRCYQVHSDDRRYPWSKIYAEEDINGAIEMFLNLTKKVRRLK